MTYTCKEDSNLKGPPLHTEHQHAWNTESDKTAPVLKTFCAPTLNQEIEVISVIISQCGVVGDTLHRDVKDLGSIPGTSRYTVVRMTT